MTDGQQTDQSELLRTLQRGTPGNTTQPQDRSIRRFKAHFKQRRNPLCSLSQSLQGCASERAFAGGNKNQAFGEKAIAGRLLQQVSKTGCRSEIQSIIH